MENTNDTHQGGDSLFAYNALTVPRRTERVLRGNKGKGWYIEQYIFKKSKTTRKYLAIAKINFKKVYNIVPQTRMIDRLKMYKISDEVIKFIEKTMTNWRMKLTAGGKSLTEVKIHRETF